MSTKTLLTAAFVFGTMLLIFLMVKGCGRDVVIKKADLQKQMAAQAELQRKMMAYQDSIRHYQLYADSLRIANALTQEQLSNLDKSYSEKSNEVNRLAREVKSAIGKRDTVRIVENAGPLADNSINLSLLYDSIRRSALATKDYYDRELEQRQNTLGALRSQLNTLQHFADSQAVNCAGRSAASPRSELFAIVKTGAFVSIPTVVAGAGLVLRSKGGALYQATYNRAFNYGDYVEIGYGRRLSIRRHR